MWRSRWAAIGAAVAVTLGAGGLVAVDAASSQSAFVAVTPQRVLDTRSDIGLSDAFVGGQPRQLDVTGTIPVVGADGSASSALVVPDGATAIVANVTALRSTSTGFVSVRPGTATGVPTTSNINIPIAGGIYPNSVTVELPTTGAAAGTIDLFYFANSAGGTTDLLLDIVGYYVEGTGTAGPQGPAGPAGPKGDPGMRLVSTFFSLAEPGIGAVFPPPAPAGYTNTLALDPGTYYVTGDLTVRNDGAGEALISCAFFVDDTNVTTLSQVSLPPGNVQDTQDQLSFGATFDVATAGDKGLSFRCRDALGGLDSKYYYMNMFVFAVSK